MNILSKDTICAVATAPGGAIGIIRVSGEQAIAITDRIFMPIGANGKTLAQRKPYTLAFGNIVTAQGDIIDQVLVSIFHAPHSYTGEQSVEISCHASTYILQQVMQLLVANGCRPAEPGEYTQRAFLNGKMDLSQAEAVADLIASHSAASHRMAMNQMRGAFSTELSDLRDKLLHLTSLIELELDFSDHEELEFADRTQLVDVAQKIQHTVQRLIQSFRIGNAIKNGIPTVIIGETNAGKSTLLNLLVGEERAIVSDIHGTTRDVIEDTVNIDGKIFRFIDTAGIRDTTDTIESIGIERSLAKIKQAEIILLMLDATCANEQYQALSNKVLPLCQDKHLLVIINKCDKATPTTITPLPENATQINLSAKTKQGIEQLKTQLSLLLPDADIMAGNAIVSNIRHLKALQSANDDINRVLEGLHTDLPTDLVSQDLRSCLYHLAQITGGEIQTNEVLGNIFKHFCVGK
ncbi:MAG: tRNA uridine-5-carboxymethylaminomethyl(34) synthesis GTPase MnmE [Prevotella sp.]|nr:tRNA uridine-5-carboxymethylaminomethyl(34) synthesis GTPase MnmE [Prevotella sp.]